MQFNKSHISFITTFEHKKREEKESVHCSFQAWSFTSFLSSVLVVVSVGKSKLILVFSVFFFFLSRSSFRLGQGWDSTFGTWMCGTGTRGSAWGSSDWVSSWDWGGKWSCVCVASTASTLTWDFHSLRDFWVISQKDFWNSAKSCRTDSGLSSLLVIELVVG